MRKHIVGSNPTGGTNHKEYIMKIACKVPIPNVYDGEFHPFFVIWPRKIDNSWVLLEFAYRSWNHHGCWNYSL